MSTESPEGTFEKNTQAEAMLLRDADKEIYHDAVFSLLGEYPDNFFTGLFEKDAQHDFDGGDVIVAKEEEEETIVGCLFLNPETNELNWLAVSKNYTGDKKKVAKDMFAKAFAQIGSGSKAFWYVNAEDAVFEGKPVGEFFEPARRLYREMGATLTKVENKFGEGNHVYLVEIDT